MKDKSRKINKRTKASYYSILIAILLALFTLAYNGEINNGNTDDLNIASADDIEQVQNSLDIEDKELDQNANNEINGANGNNANNKNDSNKENGSSNGNNEGNANSRNVENNNLNKSTIAYGINEKPNIDVSSIPEYSSSPYVTINNGNPFFDENDFTTESFENYSDLDSLGRCQFAIANIGKDLMPTEPRGEIGSVKPTGWHLVKYDGIDGKYLYNRCHLIGYQLTGENANPKNLITGTRYLNTKGMLPFENMVAEYIRKTSNHVMYRVTPIFQGNNLLASGVIMEAESVEDNGAGIKFNVYCYNVQPGISINYANGDSSKN